MALLVGISPAAAIAAPVIIPVIVAAAVIEAIASISAISTAIPPIPAVPVIIAMAAAPLSFLVGIAISRGPAQREDVIIKVSSLGAARALGLRRRWSEGASRHDACGQKKEAEKTA
jgi:hypothetical protein